MRKEMTEWKYGNIRRRTLLRTYNLQAVLWIQRDCKFLDQDPEFAPIWIRIRFPIWILEVFSHRCIIKFVM